ncbi:MAG: hypothetical protein E3J71_10530 [Candidatus Stahlbacteria bacterium]|nr:MAG: hypothetical protein E3J71_10530 [Candidatus Stahlbacteria bacterium]
MSKLDEFCDKFPFDSTSRTNQAIAFLWFHLRSNNIKEANLTTILKYFEEASLPRQNITEMRKAFNKKKSDVHKGNSRDSYRLDLSTSKALDEAFGYIFKTNKEPEIVDKAGVNSTPFLTQAQIDDSYKMAQLYRILHCYENSVRRLIESVLKKKYGDDWWDKSTSNTIKSNVKDRKEKEDKRKWLTPRGASELYYVDWGDLVYLMRQHKDEFSKIITDFDTILSDLEKLESLRHIIAHNGVLPNQDDFDRIRISFKDWKRQVKGTTI